MMNRMMLRRAGGVPVVNPFADALVAYSLRNLGLGATNVVRVRRSSDNTEQDFTATQITDGTLTSFCGAGNGFVSVWYDQKGFQNLTRGGDSAQPQIFDNGNLIISNGKPALSFVNGKYFTPWSNGSIINNTTFSYIGSKKNIVKTEIFFSGFNQNYQFFTFGTTLEFNNGVTLNIPNTPALNQQFSIFGNINAGSTSQFYYNDALSVDANTGALGFDGLTFGGGEGDGQIAAEQNVNEFIIWGNTKNRTDVIANQNSYYNTF